MAKKKSVREQLMESFSKKLSESKKRLKEGGSDEIRGKNQGKQIRAMWAKDPEGEGHPSHPDNR